MLARQCQWLSRAYYFQRREFPLVSFRRQWKQQNKRFSGKS
jgi:hypothetical protein